MTVESVTEALSRLAPKALAAKLAAGPGFSVQQGDASPAWSLVKAEQRTGAAWTFRYECPDALSAVCSAELDPAHKAAVFQVGLTNTAGKPSKPFSRLFPFFLKLVDIQTAIRIMSAAGGGYATGYPPHYSYRINRYVLQFPAHAIELSSCPETGRSSGKDLPIAMVSPDIASDSPGLFFGLEWSLAWHARISFAPSGDEILVSMGPQVDSLVLGAGETIELPRVHVGFFEGGFDAGSNALRRYIRDCITPRHNGAPVLPPVAYNIWPGIVAPYTEDDLYPQIDAAAEMGVEVFIVDDAWYPGDFPHGVGNWEPDPEKFPRGLESFAEHVKSKGMDFGLFFEPERAAAHTRILREHPEFFYPVEHPAWGGYLMNMGLPQAREHVFRMISDFVERYDVGYIRWDFNIAPLHIFRAVDPTGKVQFDYCAGLYEVWDRLLARYPQLTLECCAGGGNRLDLGSMRRTHCCWFNDNMTHPHISHAMQLSANVFLPAYYLGASLGWPLKGRWKGMRALENHPDAELPGLSFLSRMAGEFFLQGRIADWSDEQRARARRWIAVYKNVRHLLVKDYYRLLPQPESEADWDAGQFCDGSEVGVVFVFRWAGATDSLDLPLRQIDDGREYAFRDEASGTEITHRGAELVEKGLSVALAPNSAKLLSYRAT